MPFAAAARQHDGGGEGCASGSGDQQRGAGLLGHVAGGGVGRLPELAAELWDYVMEVASGRPTASEKMGFREIAIFKSGVTL